MGYLRKESYVDLAQTAQDLINRNERKTQHLSSILRATARSYFTEGVRELLRALQESAVEEEFRTQTAPLAVQANHSAVEDLEKLK